MNQRVGRVRGRSLSLMAVALVVQQATAQEVLRENGVSYRRYNINEFAISHCWCCYSMRDNACRYPCRDQIDDMPATSVAICATNHPELLDSAAWRRSGAGPTFFSRTP